MDVRRVLRVVLVAVLLAGAACGDDSSSSGGDGGQAEASVDTPARTQLEWVLASGPTADDAQMAEHFAPAFLMQVPAADVRAVLAGLIGATVREVTDSNDTKLKAQVSTNSGIPLLAEIAVEDEEPHRIIGLLFSPPDLPDSPASWEEVDERLGDVGARGALFAAEVEDDGKLRVIHERSADEVGPVGSVLKLYVLGALVEAVSRGDVGWDDLVTVEEGDVSLGAGQLKSKVGGQVSLREAAKLMISISDNTATDVVMRAVGGRPAVEAVLADMGMGEEARSRTLPFLTTREAFIVKWGEQRAEYAAASEEERRELLADLDEPLPDLDEVDPEEPVEIDRIEWFASPREVAAAHLWLEERRSGPDADPLSTILGSNPGMPLDPATWIRASFKGGSEPGVLAVSWLLERGDGRRFVLVGQSSDPDEALDDLEGVAIVQGALALLADE